MRPGAREFLKAMSQFFLLHVCSSGSRDYVTKAMHILDNGAKLVLVPGGCVQHLQHLQNV